MVKSAYVVTKRDHLFEAATFIGSPELEYSPDEPVFKDYWLNPIAFGKAKIVYNFGLSECNRI